MQQTELKHLPHLLTRQQAANFLGIDPVTFDKIFRQHRDFRCFMVGRQARYTVEQLTEFVRNHLV